MRSLAVCITLAVILLSGISGMADELPAVGGFVHPDAFGSFKIEDTVFLLNHADAKWKTTSLKSGNVKVAADFSKASAQEFGLRGDWTVRGGIFTFEQRIVAGEHRTTYSVKLAAAKPVATRAMFLGFQLPPDQKIIVDGKQTGFGKEYNPNQVKHSFRNVKSLKIQMERGELELNGDFNFQLEDLRRFKKQYIICRVWLKPAGGNVKKAELSLSISYRPYALTMLDLRGAANMAFADEVPDDGKGGWTDQGPDNDLRSLPLGQRDFAGVPFTVIDPANNGGRSAIVLRGKAKPNFPERVEVVLPEPAKGRYLYVLNAIAWPPRGPVEVGNITVEYTDNEFVDQMLQTFPLRNGVDVSDFWNPGTLKNAMVGWRGRNSQAEIGLYVTRFDLGGSAIRRICFESTGKATWMIVGATLSDQSVKIDAKAEGPVVMAANDKWIPFTNKRGIPKGNILDFSEMLDAPAGKHGFLRVVGEHFEYEKRPGVPVRFHGASIGFRACFRDAKTVDAMADEIASLGYNFVRFHGPDQFMVEKDTVSLNPQLLDQLDYLVAALKKRGVSMCINLATNRRIPVEALPPGTPRPPAKLLMESNYKALLFIDEGVMKNFEAVNTNLLNHVNPYTGVAWKDEPAIVMYNLVNEDTFHFILRENSWAMPFYKKKFSAWLKKKGLPPNTPAEGGPWLRFLGEVYAAGHARMEKLVRGLGSKALITDLNIRSSNSVSVWREPLDFVDNHFYFNHPRYQNTTPGKALQPPIAVAAGSAIADYTGTLAGMFSSRLFGKPFTLTEWDFVNPNPYRLQGEFLVGGYAALQGWSMVNRHCYIGTDYNFKKPDRTLALFHSAGDPVRLLAERAIALMFLRGDVKTAVGAYPLLLNRRFLEGAKPEDMPPGVMSRLGLVSRAGTLLADPGKVPLWPEGTRMALTQENVWTNTGKIQTFLSSGSISNDAAALVKSGALPSALVDLETGRFTSDTGEIELHRNNDTFKVVTPRSEAFVLGAGKSLAGKFATVSNEETFASFLIAARDDQPLAASKRILLLHLTNTRNTGMKLRNAEGSIVDDWGKLPQLARKGSAQITLNASLEGYKLFALDFVGTRCEEIRLERENGRSRFRLETVYGGEPRFAYELIRE